MKHQDIWTEVQAEIREHKAEVPYWPIHVVSQAARVAEPAQKMVELSLGIKYEGKDQEREMRKACLRTIAAAIRYLETNSV